MVVLNIFYFHPYLQKISNFTMISQLGWFNHQLVIGVTLIFFVSLRDSEPLALFLRPVGHLKLSGDESLHFDGCAEQLGVVWGGWTMNLVKLYIATENTTKNPKWWFSKGILPKMAETFRLRIYFINCPDEWIVLSSQRIRLPQRNRVVSIGIKMPCQICNVIHQLMAWGSFRIHDILW